MTFLPRFLLLAALPTAALIVLLTRSAGNAQGLGLSAGDYAKGAKRRAAVLKKVTPGLRQAFAKKNLAWNSPIFMRAFKQEKVLELWVKKENHFVLFRSYPILAASGTLGPKERQGDRQVPEGFYYVTPKSMNPESRFHLSFNLGYPNAFDRAHDRTGDFIMIHGAKVSIGCLAMGDPAIEEIYTLAHAAFDGGQRFFRVHLFPFRMTETAMKKHAGSSWLPFWQNLRQGYQWFEEQKNPPNVTVANKRYRFD